MVDTITFPNIEGFESHDDTVTFLKGLTKEQKEKMISDRQLENFNTTHDNGWTGRVEGRR